LLDSLIQSPAAPAAARARAGLAIGCVCYPWFERDPLLEPLRRDDESRPLFDELKVMWERARARDPA
jgi:hypothetical protein